MSGLDSGLSQQPEPTQWLRLQQVAAQLWEEWQCCEYKVLQMVPVKHH
ncbi:hypothetical protein OOQ53_004445 [Salmonella enterica]|nr:hypothetical protein [Salmonella enterica]